MSIIGSGNTKLASRQILEQYLKDHGEICSVIYEAMLEASRDPDHHCLHDDGSLITENVAVHVAEALIHDPRFRWDNRDELPRRKHGKGGE